MTYKETLEWMFSRLPMYQRQGRTALKKDLKNILLLDKRLDNPSLKFKSIHIGGTNGKGSVSHILASILQEEGYKTGLYTSPHLKDFRERIRINGEKIRKNCVINFIKKHKTFLEQNNLSFFEMTVGMAFDYFAKKKVDIAIIEVGLGGRLDSTNILNPILSVITNISKDHTQMLGKTLDKIAFEKAGIIKKKTPVVIGEVNKYILPVFDKIARQKQADLYIVKNNKHDYVTSLQGVYQKKNVRTVLLTIEVLKKLKFDIKEENIRKGLLNVTGNTGLRGRWDIIQKKPMIITDTAHNEAGLKEVIRQLMGLNYKKLHIVLSFVSDKNLNKILPLFPKNAVYYFSKSGVQRALNERVLQKKAEKYGLSGIAFSTVKEAFKEAKDKANNKDIIFVGGSTFTVSEIL